ncbi:MAG: RNA polymerase sigma-54 factor, partial [Bdellovibrionales bacterium]|nr:RNA polymerase sigma-54 factor [Bdellovibrionales bacterium]
MAVKLGQYLKQTQNLMMTPQLQQAIKLLTLTHLEMSNVIAEEMVENPMLEEAGDNDSKKEEDYKVEKLEMDNKEAESNDFEAPSLMERDDFDWSNYLDNYNSNSSTPPSMVSRDPDEQVNYENIVSSEEGLTEHLEWQLRMMDDMSEQEWEIANQIIYNIGASGYLEADFDEIISLVDASEQEALEVLRKIQQLDPIGCGSRNLKECLLIQAELE